MANIVNHQTSQLNLVIVPERAVDTYNLNIEKIKTKLQDIFEDSKPVTTQFPELTLVYEPTHQIGVTVVRDLNRIVIADSKITPYNARDLSSFLNFAKQSAEITTKENTIKNYGFNVTSVFDIEDGETVINSGELIKNNFLNNTLLEETLGNVDSAGIRVVYTSDEARCDLKLEPRYGPNLEATNSIILTLNVHFIGDLPSLTNLKRDFQKYYDSLSTHITKLLP